MTLSALGIFSAAGAGVVSAGSYELIETTILGSSATSITFSNLGTYSSTYKHLQVRYVARSDRSTFSQEEIRIRLNGVTTNTSYDMHFLQGDGATVYSSNNTADNANSNIVGTLTASGSQTGAFAAGVLDILDAYSTTKNKTIRNLSGQESQNAGGFGGRFINLMSLLFSSTDSTTSVTLLPMNGPNFITGSRFSLYGIKG